MVEAVDEAMRVRTPGGVVSVRWASQLAFFAEYLEATGLFEGWLKRRRVIVMRRVRKTDLVDACATSSSEY